MRLVHAAEIASVLLFGAFIGQAQLRCDSPRNPIFGKYEKLGITDGWFEVYRLPGNVYALWEPRQSERVFSYLIVGEKQALLFDSGFGIGHIDEVVRKLTALPVMVLNSHTHYDHVGGNYAFANVLGIDSDYTRNSAQGFPNSKMAASLAPGQFCPPLPEGVAQEHYVIRPFRVSKFVSDGDVIDLGGRKLEVIATPGHTPDAVCLLDRTQRELFTGDTFYPGSLWLWVPETDLEAYQKSVERIARLAGGIDVLRPAHNLPEADPKMLARVSPALSDIRAGRITTSTVRNGRRTYQFEGFSIQLANHEAAQPAESKQAQADRIFGAFTTHTPGCAVGVAQGGAVVLKSGYGMADLERNVPITADTVFESGSVAKQFTAAALMLLAQQGKISLDDPLRKYLPEIPDYGVPLTIRHVMSHVSGLREWRLVATFSGIAEGSHVLTNQDLLRIASKQRALNFPPGAAYSYTNTGFNILTIAVERALANAKTFQDFTREAIFEPLQMSHTRWRDDFRAIVPNRALAYGRAPGGGWVQQTPIENIIGAGGMLSTVGDWLLWNENFTHAKVGGAQLVKAMQTPATLSNGKTITYAAGLVVSTHDGLREVSHGGSTGGYRTWLGRYPDQGISVAVMCNSAQANPAGLGRDVARLWTGATPAPKSAQFPAAPAKFGEWAGMYRKVRDNTVTEVRLKEGKLSMDPNVQLVPTGASTFLAGDNQVAFESGGFRIVTPDGETAYERVQPAHPSAGELAALAGAYQSPETGTTLTVAAKDGELTLTIESSLPVRLRPTFQEAFMMQGTAIRFLRGADGSVTGLSAGDDRAWDLRFTRVR